MRRSLSLGLVLLFVLGLAISASAANGSLPGFLGIPFGADRYQVKSVMENRANTTRLSYPWEGPDVETMYYVTNFNGYSATTEFDFYLGEFARAVVSIDTPELSTTYQSLRDDLFVKYGMWDGTLGKDSQLTYGGFWSFDDGKESLNLGVKAQQGFHEVTLAYVDSNRFTKMFNEHNKDL